MWFIIKPHSIVSISIIEEHCAFTSFLIIDPITSIFSSEPKNIIYNFAFEIIILNYILLVLAFTYPECALSTPQVVLPTTLINEAQITLNRCKWLFDNIRLYYFVLISISIELNAEPVFAVVSPISNVFSICNPLFDFLRSIFVTLFFLISKHCM